MIKKFFLFKESIDSKNPKIKKLVDEANELLKKINGMRGEGANIYTISAVIQMNPIIYDNNKVIIEYGTGANYKKDRDKEQFEVGIDSDSEIIFSLKSWIKILKENIFNESEEGKNKFFNKIKDLVDELNILIHIAYDKYGYKIGIYDTTSTWQEDEEYSPILYKYGEYLSIKTSLEKKDYDLKKISPNELKELILELETTIKYFKKFLKKEGIYPLNQKDVNNLQKLIEILNTDTNQKIFKKVEIKGVNSFFINKVPYKNKLEEDLNIYNTIPGIYMIQEDDYIKIYVSYYQEVYIVHEQYLSRLLKLYNSIKN